MKHNFLRRLGALALSLAMALSLCATPAWAAGVSIVGASIKVDKTHETTASLSIGDEIQLRAFTVDSSGNETPVTQNSTFTWVSGDTSIATVGTGGKVTAKGKGETTITATLKNSNPAITATFQVTVTDGTDPGPAPDPEVPVTGVVLSKRNLTLELGQSETLTATVQPSDASDKSVTWSSRDTSVATVDQNGNVTAVGIPPGKEKGEAIITVLASNGISNDTCIVTVTKQSPKISLDRANLVLEPGDTSSLTATVVPAGSQVKWASSNKRIATVDDTTNVKNIVTALTTRGTTTISATLLGDDGKPVRGVQPAKCTVTVIDDKSVPITGVTLNEKSRSIPVGGTFKLTATVSPSNAANKGVTWSSTDEAIATVDKNGNVKAVGEGTVGITVTTDYGGRTATCTVTVTPAATGIGPITGPGVVSSAGGTLPTYTFGRTSRSDSATVTAPLTPSSSKDSVQWKSDNNTIVTVSGTGDQAVITRKGAGTTQITAVPLGPDKKPRAGVDPAKLEVVVSGITFEKNTLTMMENQRDTLEYTLHGDAASDGTTDCEWMSSDPAVVSVNAASGLLTAFSRGTVVITARKSGYEAHCTVTVSEDTSGVITLTGNHPAGSPVNMSSASATSSAGSGSLASVLNAVSKAKTRTVNADGTQSAGYGLLYVTNLSVASTDQGILHDQHHSSADTGAGVGGQDTYYPGTAPSGQRSLRDLSFVPSTTFSGTAEIAYTGVSTNHQTFTGVIRVSVNGTGDVMYSSTGGSVVYFLAEDFNFYHPNLRSVSFTPPQDTRGTLYYNYSTPDQPGAKVTGSDVYNRTSSPSLDKVVFVPAPGYNGTVAIPYKGTDTAGRSITGRVTISVSGNRNGSSAPGDIYYSFPNGGLTTMRASDFYSACRSVLGETLSYVRFELPPSSDGTLFYNYRGFADYDSDVDSTTNYYYSGTPALAGVSFVPTTTTPSRVDISYTGYSTRGNTFAGTIHIGEAGVAPQTRLRYTVATGKAVNLSARDNHTP